MTEFYKETKLKKPFRKSVWFWLIVFIVFVIIISGYGNGEISQPQPTKGSEQPSFTTEQKLELGYTESIAAINKDVENAMWKMSNLLNSFPFWTEQEIITIALNTVIIEQSYEVAKEITPPERFKSVHSLWLLGISKYAEAMPIMRYGIDNLDANKTKQASELIGKGMAFINQATKELNKLK